MSRCFPFPPPGYERKTKADNPDLLKKEKHKEEKHKKEKRDKEKKEGKEKREKERSDEKHKEKKDKKEKHRDKKKDKEKDRDKDKEKHKSNSFLPDEKKIVGPAEAHVHKSLEKSKNRENDTSATLDEKRVTGPSAFQNGDQVTVSKSSHLASGPHSFKHAREYEERRLNTPLPDNISSEPKKDEVVKLAEKSAGFVARERMDGRATVGEPKSSGSPLFPNSVGMVQNRVGGMAGFIDKKRDPSMEENESDVSKRAKTKEKKYREKAIHKDKGREKETKKKEEKVKATSEDKHVEQQSRTRHGSENHMLESTPKDSGAHGIGLQNIPKDVNLGKRKGSGLNGIYDEHTTGPNKVARTMASSHLPMENGRSLEPCQNSSSFAPKLATNIKVDPSFALDDKQRPPMNIKVDGKESKINGIIPPPLLTKSSRKTAKEERKSHALKKAPHPDTKYLSRVLSVPKVDEWSNFDDQEWLFGSKSSETRNPDVEFSGIDETPQVWSNALWLETVDVHALPYVIPR